MDKYNQIKLRRFPMKSFKAMMSEVAQPEPAEEKAFKAQHTVVADKHPVALETQHKGTKPKAKRKADQEGDANYDLAYESVDLEEMKVKNSEAAFKLETEISNLEKRIAKLKPLAPKDDEANMKLSIARKSLKQKQDAHSALMREAVDSASPDEGSMAMKQADFLAYVAKEMKDHLKSGKEFPEWMQNKLSKLQQAAQDLHSNFGDHGENEKDDMDESLSPKQKKIDHNKNGKIDGQDLAAIRAKKSVKEELKGNQHKIDKNKNGKIDAHDFKLLKKEEVDQVNEGRGDALIKTTAKNMDDNDKHIEKLKKAGIFAQQGAGAGHHIIVGQRDHEKAKSLLTGHLKEEVEQVDEAQSHQAKTTMKHINNPTAGEKKAAKDIKPGIKGVADRIAMLASAQARGALKKEAAEKPASPFDLKNYKSQIPTKAGEKAGFDSKKVSTGTVYSRKPVKEAAYEKDMDDKKKVIVKGVKGMKSTPFTKTFRNMAAYDKWSDSDAAGDYEVKQVMHEEVELDEAFRAGIVKLKDNSSMVLKKEDADILNKLMGGMSAGSVKKMTETAMKDKTGFAEILAFAKEAM
jgi:hypothetical protein